MLTQVRIRSDSVACSCAILRKDNLDISILKMCIVHGNIQKHKDIKI